MAFDAPIGRFLLRVYDAVVSPRSLNHVRWRLAGAMPCVGGQAPS
jgi:hypothetical protein